MRSALRDVFETLILTVIIFLLVRSVVQNFKVEGQSMEPSLHNGQYLLINKAVYWRIGENVASRLFPKAVPDGDAVYVFRGPQRGDIIVFRYPKDLSRDFIKRVIALPGDTVEIKEGHVYVNNSQLDEGYLTDQPHYSEAAQKIPPAQYFVLGDNRNASSDSHVWGLVPEENIIGKAWVTYWPVDQLGIVPNVALVDQLQRSH